MHIITPPRVIWENSREYKIARLEEHATTIIIRQANMEIIYPEKPKLNISYLQMSLYICGARMNI